MISSDALYDQRPTDEPSVTHLLEFMLQKEIHFTAHSGAYSGMFVHNIAQLASVCVCVCVCLFVGSCLATKVFIGNLWAVRRGWVIIK